MEKILLYLATYYLLQNMHNQEIWSRVCIFRSPLHSYLGHPPNPNPHRPSQFSTDLWLARERITTFPYDKNKKLAMENYCRKPREICIIKSKKSISHVRSIYMASYIIGNVRNMGYIGEGVGTCDILASNWSLDLWEYIRYWYWYWYWFWYVYWTLYIGILAHIYIIAGECVILACCTGNRIDRYLDKDSYYLRIGSTTSKMCT